MDGSEPSGIPSPSLQRDYSRATPSNRFSYDDGDSMAPANPPQHGAASDSNLVGPHPSYINVSRMYTFQQQIQSHLIAIGTNPTREDTFRIQGVQWINDVRIYLQL
jgi:CTD kinase subunit beta